MATISRSEMQAAIAAGGVVLHNGVLYNDPLDLPTEAELAKGDPAREKKAQDDIQAQIAALQAQIDGLKAHDGGKPVAPAPTPTSTPPAPAPHPGPAPAGPSQPPIVVTPKPNPNPNPEPKK